MSKTQFELTSHWQIPAPPERVWDVLVDSPNWPKWWSYVRAVTPVKRGRPDGTGNVQRVTWSTRLPYSISFDIEVVEVIAERKLRGLARGELQGQGTWLLEPDGEGTHVTYLWQVDLGKAWMRALAPLMSPVFKWNHDGLMAAGEAGLIRYLAQSQS
jgi:uncharacterized protein YndB with AHSA1/START domain